MKRSETKVARIFKNGKNLNLLQLSDVKLRTDDGCTFDVHRVTLARSSDYFRAMFCGISTERSEFGIPGISGACLSDILCYVYTGDIQVTDRNVRDLIIAADYLLLKDLGMEIKRNIKDYLTEANCLRILQAVHQIGNVDIFRECFRFVQTRFEGVIRCQKNDLADLPLEVLILILSNRSLYVYSENTVWRAIVKWTKKDIPLRMSYVPQLLLSLAVEDMGEELATKILQHEIISQNALFRRARSQRDLQSDQISKRKKLGDLDVLLSFLRSYSPRFMEPNSHRIPLKLHVLFSRSGAGDNHNLYITYDENPDLMRKITDVCYEPDALIAVRHNIYTYKWGQFREFNLKTMSWLGVGMSFVHGYPDAYRNANNRWMTLNNISYATAVAIGEKIYLVGNTYRFGETTMQMFDPVTQQWSRLPPPTVYRCKFRLVAYHQKIYLIESYSERHLGLERLDIEVFDLAKNLWEMLPALPFTYSSPGAVVFNDQLVFYDRSYGYKRNTKIARWNDANKCWEELQETNISRDLHFLQSSCSVDDVETIRIITKQNRDPGTQMEKIDFI